MAVRKRRTSTTDTIGSGSYGIVRRSGDSAIKSFHRLNHMIQELAVMKYMNDSKYVVNCTGYDLFKLELKMPLWDGSLRSTMKRYRLSEKNKRTLHRDILMGIAHLHHVGIIHCDIKPSNILVNIKPLRACLGDLGLSSCKGYARTTCTAAGYRLPRELIRQKLCEYHDIFSFIIMSVELFSEKSINKIITPKELVYYIKSRNLPEDVRSVLLHMSDPHQGISATKALQTLYHTDPKFSVPAIKLTRPSIPLSDKNYLKDHVRYLAGRYEIKRERRAYQVLLERLFTDKYDSVKPKDHLLYVCSIMIIFSSLFSRNPQFNKSKKIPHFNVHLGVKYVKHRWTEKEIIYTINEFICTTNILNLMLLPPV